MIQRTVFMRKLAILLLLPLFLYGSAMGYLWYRAKSETDKAIQAAAPFAKISYGSIYISPLGDEVGLNDILIRSNTSSDEFRIEKIHINVPHIGYFISARSSLDKGTLPEHLGIYISRMHLDLNSETFSMLDQLRNPSPEEQPHQVELIDLDAFGCGEKKYFTLNDVRSMGIKNVVLDFSAEIDHDKARDGAAISIKIRDEKLFGLELFADLRKKLDEIHPASAFNVIPKGQINYRDSGYYKLRNTYCAKLNESSAEEYIDEHVKQLSAMLNAQFPENFVTVYKQYMLKGGSINIRLNPSGKQTFNNLQQYSLANVMDMLTLSITINGKRLDKDLIEWVYPSAKTSVGSAAKSKSRSDKISEKALPQATTTTIINSQREAIKNATDEPSQDHQEKEERSTEFANLVINVDDSGKYINRLIEITTVDGKVRSGLLEEVNQDRIYLIMNLSVGTLNYPIDIRNVKQVRLINELM